MYVQLRWLATWSIGKALTCKQHCTSIAFSIPIIMCRFIFSPSLSSSLLGKWPFSSLIHHHGLFNNRSCCHAMCYVFCIVYQRCFAHYQVTWANGPLDGRRRSTLLLISPLMLCQFSSSSFRLAILRWHSFFPIASHLHFGDSLVCLPFHFFDSRWTLLPAVCNLLSLLLLCVCVFVCLPVIRTI